jgi:hypothetical protein
MPAAPTHRHNTLAARNRTTMVVTLLVLGLLGLLGWAVVGIVLDAANAIGGVQ